MARKFKKKVLFAKIEGEYGNDALPTGSGDPVPILTRDCEIGLMEGPTAEREIDRPTLGNSELFHTGPHTVITCRIEATGSGTAGTPPAYNPILRACGLAQVAVGDPATSVEYRLIDSGEESVSLYYYQDGILHKLRGVRGSISLAMTPGEMPYWTLRLVGLRVAPEAIAMPAADFSDFKTPQAVTNAQTGDFSLHGYAGTLVAFSVDVAQEVGYRNVVGDESVQITDRKPTGSLTIEEPALATKDFHAIIAAHTTGALALRHGVGAGHIVKVEGPAVQLVQPKIGNNEGIATLEMSMRFMPTAANNEIKFIFE